MTSAGARTVDIVRKGSEGEPVVIVDGYLSDPQGFVDEAARAAFADGGRFYPGVRAPVPAPFYKDLFQPLAAVLRQVFGYGEGAHVAECSFSLVTTKPINLLPIQRLPHYDSLEPQRLAVLLYLGRAGQGGTSFYRHRATGYETVTADRFDAYKAQIESEVATLGPPSPGYFRGDDARFERIHACEAAFNRVVVYRGINLHSGDIPEDFDFDPDPRSGRLTVNGFLVPAARV